MSHVIVLPALDLTANGYISYRLEGLPSDSIAIELEAPTDQVQRLFESHPSVVVRITSEKGAPVVSCGGVLGMDWIAGYEIKDRGTTHLSAPAAPARFFAEQGQQYQVVIEVSASDVNGSAPLGPVVPLFYTTRRSLGFNP